MRVVLILSLQQSCELDDQAETFKRLLVNAAKTVIDELRRKQQSQHEYLQIRAFSFFERAESLSVNDEAILAVEPDEFGPHPQSLGAGIDGVTNIESLISIEQYSIKDVALACPILASNCDDMQIAGGESFEQEQRFVGNVGI